MTVPRRRGTLVSLLLSSHPLPTVAMTTTLTSAAALTGRRPRECLLVAGTVLSGQLTIGWLNDLVDADRDRRSGRRDKPVALGWVPRRTVWAATGGMVAVTVPLSLANGTPAGLAHLGLVAGGWSYDLGLKATALSWLPYAVGFGLLPSFLSYGGWGPGRHGGPPTATLTASVAALSVGVHFLNALPDLADDEEMGVRHLPLRVADRIGAPSLRRIALAGTGLAAGAVLVSGALSGVRR